MTIQLLTKTVKTIGDIAAKSNLPENPDLDGDGVLDEEELRLLDEAVYVLSTSEASR